MKRKSFKKEVNGITDKKQKISYEFCQLKPSGNSDRILSMEQVLFPFDHAHSAMGKYHYYPVVGYTGQWYDPIVNANYRGPSWLITELDGKKYIEQMRVRNPLTRNVSPLLVAGDVD